MDRNYLKMRVWERGSGEGRWPAVRVRVHSAVAAVLCGHADKDTDIRVKLPGGELTVRYNGDTVFMTGECKKVFEGVVEI